LKGDNQEPETEEISKRSWPETVFEQVISYNLDEAERPGGLKVRFKVTIATGKKAAALDARQAEAVRRLLEWTLEYRARPEASR
jgi:hypothetical protein